MSNSTYENEMIIVYQIVNRGSKNKTFKKIYNSCQVIFNNKKNYLKIKWRLEKV